MRIRFIDDLKRNRLKEFKTFYDIILLVLFRTELFRLVNEDKYQIVLKILQKAFDHTGNVYCECVLREHQIIPSRYLETHVQQEQDLIFISHELENDQHATLLENYNHLNLNFFLVDWRHDRSYDFEENFQSIKQSFCFLISKEFFFNFYFVRKINF